MKRLQTALLSVALLGLGSVLAYPVFAHCGKCAADGKKIAMHLDQNKTTLSKAVAAAETHSKGRAISVTSGVDAKGTVGVHVFCVAGEASTPKIMKCTFDSTTGTIKDMKEVQEFPHSHDDADAKHDHAHDASGNTDGLGGGSVNMIKSKTVEAGCAKCIYKDASADGCPLAVMIDGTLYMVQGAKWPNHSYCDAKQEAIVTGTIEGKKFVASSLQPVK